MSENHRSQLGRGWWFFDAHCRFATYLYFTYLRLCCLRCPSMTTTADVIWCDQWTSTHHNGSSLDAIVGFSLNELNETLLPTETGVTD